MFGHSMTATTLLARSDSKNPATTCKGITTKGLPCRRDLAAAKTSFYGQHNSVEGVLAILDAGHAAAFFCHDHRNQADALTTSLRNRSEIVTIRKRDSVDTLVERLGVLSFEEDQTVGGASNYHAHADRGSRRDYRKRNELPQKWQDIQGPLMVVPEEVLANDQLIGTTTDRSRTRQQRHANRPIRRSNVKASWSCCIRADDEYSPPPRKRRQQSSRHYPQTQQPNLRVGEKLSRPTAQQAPTKTEPVVPHSLQTYGYVSYVGDTVANSPRLSSPTTPSRPQLQPRHSSTSPPHSQTMAFLSYIPPHLSPEVTSSLLAELSKPISDADEDGYIYIYWLTPESEPTKPDDETASSLLDPDEYWPSSPITRKNPRHNVVTNGVANTRRVSEALQRYASVKRAPREPQKILLKIGRSSNVHRRMTQWTKQCGQNITLIRYYPHVSSRPASSSLYPQLSSERRAVPHAHRVERLIHLELADKRITDKTECKSCGRVHREWFEVEATKQAVRDVDEVIKRWVSWAESYS